MEIARPFPAIGASRPGFWSELVTRVAAARCRLMHRSISRPVNGKYLCWTCLREFHVEW